MNKLKKALGKGLPVAGKAKTPPGQTPAPGQSPTNGGHATDKQFDNLLG